MTLAATPHYIRGAELLKLRNTFSSCIFAAKTFDMPFLPTPIPDLLIFEPKVWGDARGYFFESYSQQTFKEAGLHYHFIQDNEAMSSKGVLRGMHFQKDDAAQAKLVRVTHGEVFDAVVDLREDSPSYRQWFGLVLSAENKRQLLIPRGFAHGYLVLSETAVFNYKCDNRYVPQAEGGLRHDDPAVGINWPKLDCTYTLSEKDQGWPLLGDGK